MVKSQFIKKISSTTPSTPPPTPAIKTVLLLLLSEVLLLLEEEEEGVPVVHAVAPLAVDVWPEAHGVQAAFPLDALNVLDAHGMHCSPLGV